MPKFYIVALIATYSYDYWSEINHDDDDYSVADEGPDEHSYALIAGLEQQPKQMRIDAICSHAQAMLDDHDRKSTIVAINVLGETDWQGFKQRHAIKDEHMVGSLADDGHVTLQEFGSRRPDEAEAGWTLIR